MIMIPGLDRPTRSVSRGIGGVEVLTIIALAGFLILCILTILPKGRESARTAGCQRNLMQLGVATLLYEQAQHHYPTSAPLSQRPEGESPVGSMLNTFLVPDFLEFRDAGQAPKATQAPDRSGRVPGLVCPSDFQATTRPSALSYRANAGDEADGQTGPFAPGMKVGAAAAEAGDGLSYTAGFAERLIGTGRDGEPGPMNYASVAGPVQIPCDPGRFEAHRWRGDAGAAWAEPGWRTSIYTHVVPPNAPASCIAEDGRSAAITASSAHPGRINVWMLDGSARGVTPSITPAVWRAMGSIRSTPAERSR